MGVHQLIFTSCRRGIVGVNDGQQVYSYDANFPTEKLSSLRPLFSYKAPNLPSGVLMTEDLVSSFPQSFSYKKIDPNLYDVLLNTYLGKDYMGPTGRYGNFLSHHVLYEELTTYPAELFDSSAFRTSMAFEEVNRAETPEYLDEPQVEIGDSINIDSVSAFLQSGDRIRIFNKMAACLLESSKTNKRILINDTAGNIIKWIAALHYLLPLSCAENVSFSTYLYNPMESDWKIVGVVEEGTLYQADSPAYVFDLLNGIEPETKIDPEFAEFVEVGFTISEETLADFHGFLQREYVNYTIADEGLYGAFAIYQMDTGLFDTNSLDQAFSFLGINAMHDQSVAFINKVFMQSETITLLDDPNMHSLIIGFFNSLAQGAADLLELTFNAEGYLLDLPGGQKAVEQLWSNFNQQMVGEYRNQSAIAYRELLTNKRVDQVIELFTLFLKDKENGDPTEQFNGIVSLLEASDQLPPFIDAYYQYAVEPKQREHLLRFIMKSDVSFTEAATLVREALEPYKYGKVSDMDARAIRDVWEWVFNCGVNVDNCGKLWGLITGIYINAIKQEAELIQVANWIAKTTEKCSIGHVPSGREYLNWVVPTIIAHSDNARTLSDSISAISFNLNEDLVELMCHYPIKHYRETTWLKVAGYLFALNKRWVLDEFAEASKKLSDRDLAGLDRTIRQQYRDYPDFINNWEYLYEVIQGKGMRKLKGMFKKKDGGDEARDDRRSR